jgi:hypothetical protein
MFIAEVRRASFGLGLSKIDGRRRMRPRDAVSDRELVLYHSVQPLLRAAARKQS